MKDFYLEYIFDYRFFICTCFNRSPITFFDTYYMKKIILKFTRVNRLIAKSSHKNACKKCQANLMRISRQLQIIIDTQ